MASDNGSFNQNIRLLETERISFNEEIIQFKMTRLQFESKKISEHEVNDLNRE
jgi:hypothetical protein